MKIPDSMPALPRLPELPPPRENMETMETRFKEAYEAFRQGRMHEGLPWKPGQRQQSPNGSRGKTAGAQPCSGPSRDTCRCRHPPHTRSAPCWNRWENGGCPQWRGPSGNARSRKTRPGVRKTAGALNNASQQFDMSGPLRQTSGRGEPLRVDLTLQFNGTALIRDTVWPFNPHLIGRTLMEALKAGRSRATCPYGRRGKAYSATSRHGTLASFWTAKGPEEPQDIRGLQRHAPRRKGESWTGRGTRCTPRRRGRIQPTGSAGRYATGQELRQGTGTRANGVRRALAQMHSQAVFQAFRANNPELTTGRTTPASQDRPEKPHMPRPESQPGPGTSSGPR